MSPSQSSLVRLPFKRGSSHEGRAQVRFPVSPSTAGVIAVLLIAAALGFTAGDSLNAAEGGTHDGERNATGARSASLISALRLGLGMSSHARVVAEARTNEAGLSGISDMTPVQLFLAGYQRFDGPAYWAQHFAYRVLPCESKEWGTWYSNGFVTKAQFTHRSWTMATSQTGLNDPGNPFHVGAAVAAWTNILLEEGSHPGSEAGWPGCF